MKEIRLNDGEVDCVDAGVDEISASKVGNEGKEDVELLMRQIHGDEGAHNL